MQSKIFISNRSQAVRIPKTVAFPDDVQHVDVLKIGQSRLIVPRGKRWDDLFVNGPKVTSDFLDHRDQGNADEREAF